MLQKNLLLLVCVIGESNHSSNAENETKSTDDEWLRRRHIQVRQWGFCVRAPTSEGPHRQARVSSKIVPCAICHGIRQSALCKNECHQKDKNQRFRKKPQICFCHTRPPLYTRHWSQHMFSDNVKKIWFYPFLRLKFIAIKYCNNAVLRSAYSLNSFLFVSGCISLLIPLVQFVSLICGKKLSSKKKEIERLSTWQMSISTCCMLAIHIWIELNPLYLTLKIKEMLAKWILLFIWNCPQCMVQSSRLNHRMNK